MIDAKLEKVIQDAVDKAADAAFVRVLGDFKERFESKRRHSEDVDRRLDDIISRLETLETLETLENLESLVQPTRESRRRPKPVDNQAWQAMLATPGGAIAVAKALTSHLREAFTARGPRDAIASSVNHETSITKIVETLEACAARLEEFRPHGATDVNLEPLGSAPFASADVGLYPNCSFCARSQKDVTRIIAGPCVYICNRCVDLCNSIINEG